MRALHAKVMWVHEAGYTEDDLDAIARKLGLRDVHFRLDHVLDAEGEVCEGDLLLHTVVDTVDALVLVAG